MEDLESYKKKLNQVLKLNGIIIRSEFSSLIIESLNNAHINLNALFENCIKVICENLEKHIDANKSIERKHIERAIEACIRSGVDDHETKFTVLDAFEFPKLSYDLCRKVYSIDKKNRSTICSRAAAKTDLFRNRYRNVLQRTQRSLIIKNASLTDKKIHLHTVDHLLSVSERSLSHSLILGSLFQGPYNKWFIEDPTGMVQVDLTETKFHGGFFYESCFVLVNGHYADKILQISTMILPPGEEYKDSKSCFASINYFGGKSDLLLRESNKLVDMMEQNESGMMVFISDLCLDNPITFEKLDLLFEGLSEMPPIAFIFMGNFLTQYYGSESFEVLANAFKDLAGMVHKYSNLVKFTNFVFVPGLSDPCIPHILPRAPLPKLVSEPFTKLIPKSIFTTNPCRIQYCSREITVLRSDVLSKFMKESINKPNNKEQIDDFITKTITAQGHLSPFSLNVQPVHWSFDHTLYLYPMPNLVVIGDKCNPYHGKSKGCTIINPGSFIDSGFAFKTYIPATDSVENCGL